VFEAGGVCEVDGADAVDDTHEADDVKGKRVVITGATRARPRHTRLAKKGADLVLVGRRREGRALAGCPANVDVRRRSLVD
jgi:NAD(P)-dependent dehydrogenase (short-subunit alcohol dehydrogenase family)